MPPSLEWKLYSVRQKNGEARFLYGVKKPRKQLTKNRRESQKKNYNISPVETIHNLFSSIGMLK